MVSLYLSRELNLLYAFKINCAEVLFKPPCGRGGGGGAGGRGQLQYKKEGGGGNKF